MTLTVFSDPHLGRTLQSHTTAASRERMAETIFNTTLGALEEGKIGPKVCLGDLFDKFQNPERVIMQGLKVAERCAFIMAGNHDITADRSKVGSLEMLATLDSFTDCETLLSGFGESRCYLKMIGGAQFVFVPHHTTDDLFHASLTDAAAWAKENLALTPRRPAYLCLHCNYDSGFAVDETALSLTRKEAKALLDAGFDYILIGHDHHPREDWDGRVIIMGNMHPTGFGDITTKRVLEIADDGSHHFRTVWEAEGMYVQLEVNQLLAGECVIPEDVQFIEISGKIGPDKVLELAKLVRSLWIDFNPLAIRNKVEITALNGEGAVTHDFASIDKAVCAELEAKPELLALFNEYWAGTAPVVEMEEA